MKKAKLILVAVFAAVGVLGSYESSSAQGLAPSPASPRTIPEKNPSVTGNLSDKLNATNGVIAPPADVDPKMRTPAPNPDPHSTPVIPPPGEPGGVQGVQPK